ncbi:SDR family oxidoreductase [Streptomyces kaniharaensis]|uniref:SDR family oxidoreductase n=1 Tax=Streptomyces kaniharaensis TaxID=212423 RepID=A0A5S9CYC6_9ACTN|nr:SDR family oxidoreductase [Streptomyces kaniharaensis]AVW82957.1 short chain dehydrognase [Streptomyces kaniharaensis]MQS11296.1 SDR family oxidoreductase [Streptomyces kaniharaensis]QTK22480.1 short-chain dehydrogenase [Streptomyces kaniharaensis]
MGEPAAPPLALVTGSNRGTGRAVRSRLIADGYTVRCLNRSPCADHDDPVTVDFGDPAAVARAAEQVLADAPRLDLLVVNAVTRGFGAVADVTAQDWDEAVAVNLTAPVRLVQAALPLLRRAQGHIVLMGSHAGSRPFEGGVAYCATKAALKQVAEVLLMEERRHGVRTTLLSPGAIRNFDDDHSAYKMSVESVAEVVSWAASTPRDTVLGEIELRPGRLDTPPVVGLDRLQHV